jgi:hypothetical protein
MDANPYDKKTYQDMLLELMNLRKEDYGKFMDKLYEALTGEFKDAVKEGDGKSVSEKKNALTIMIKHFQETEEYEKCAQLKKISESLII